MEEVPATDEIVRLLQESEVFAAVPETDLTLLAEGFIARNIAVDEVVVTEGDRAGEIFLILEGAFDVFTSDKDGRKRLGALGAGNIFGEIAALTGGRRYATVQATSPARVLVNKESNFHEVLRSSRPLSEAILRSLDRYT